MLELVLGSLALSIYIGGGNILLMVALSPFLLIVLFPIFTSCAIWPVKNVYGAFVGLIKNDKNNNYYTMYEKIIDYCYKISIPGILIGLTVGLIILLANVKTLSYEQLMSIKQHSLTGIISALAIAIFFKQMSGLFTTRNNMPVISVPPDSLRRLCDLYSITNREKEIIAMIANGSSNREIC